MQVLKFGGSSVASAEAMKQVAVIIQEEIKKEETVVVVSALGKVTDMLLQSGILAAEGNIEYKSIFQQMVERHLNTCKELLPITKQSSILSKIMQQFNEIEDILNGIYLLREISDRTKDRIVCYGELLSSQILSAYLTSIGITNRWKDSREFIRTDSTYTKASVDFKHTNEFINNYFSEQSETLYIIPGFIASDDSGNTTTLGRGGSDYTASIVGAALKASVVQIWTDVSGMFTDDPRLVSNARVTPHIS